MRSGIFKLLNSFEIDLTKEMPFHKTHTVLWMRTIFDFVHKNKKIKNLEMVNQLIETFDKNYPLRFYKKDTLYSIKARKLFVDADLIDKKSQEKLFNVNL